MSLPIHSLLHVLVHPSIHSLVPFIHQPIHSYVIRLFVSSFVRSLARAFVCSCVFKGSDAPSQAALGYYWKDVDDNPHMLKSVELACYETVLV